MSTISLRLSESLHSAARALAEKDAVSMNQLIATALAEKVSALAAEDLILDRARRGDRSKFLAALEKSPDIPDDYELEEPEMAIETLLNAQSEPVQQLTKQLINCIVDADVEPYPSAANGGDLRFRNENGIFAEIKFFRRNDEVDLRLYFPPDTVLDQNYKQVGRNSKQVKYDRRLNAHESVPTEVVKLIEVSRDFMRSKRI